MVKTKKVKVLLLKLSKYSGLFKTAKKVAYNGQVLLQVWNSLLVLPGTAAH